MKNDYQTNNAIQRSDSMRFSKKSETLRKKILKPGFCSVAAGVGVLGGIAFLFTGLVCVVLHEIISADVIYNKVGTTLLIAAIPMILVGSIFLDEIRGTDA